MSYKGEQLAECLTVFGLPCKFKEMKQAPRITTYYFDFLNINLKHIPSTLNEWFYKKKLKYLY